VVGLVVFAVMAAMSANAAAATVRSVTLKRGLTKVSVRVRALTSARPPAILLSTSRAAGRGCSVNQYSYIVRQRYGRLRMSIRCPDARAGARARLVFRAPLMRHFALRNGSGTVRIAVGKPRGNVRPIVQLVTHPRDTDCTVTRSHVRASSTRLSATARVRCHRLPANTTGELAVGGLIAARRSTATPRQPTARTRTPSRTATRSLRTAPRSATSAVRTDEEDISNGCREPTVWSLGGHSASWRYCYGGLFELGPWEARWVGSSAHEYPCPEGWTRRFSAIEHPVAWTWLGYFNTELVTRPEFAWAWSWSFGLVSNWQFSGYIEFSWRYRCFRF
jgi:hypothetical protein